MQFLEGFGFSTVPSQVSKYLCGFTAIPAVPIAAQTAAPTRFATAPLLPSHSRVDRVTRSCLLMCSHAHRSGRGRWFCRARPRRSIAASAWSTPPLRSHVADDAARSVIVPAVAAGIFLARKTSSRIAGIADGTRFPAVCLTIRENKVTIFTSRNRGDDGTRLHHH